jgi:hypothetical protein
MNKRSRWIPAAVIVLAAVVVAAALSLLLGRREAGDEEEEAIPVAAPIISHTKNGEVLVHLSRSVQGRIGLETETLVAATRPVEFTAYGVVLDPAPLISLEAQLVSAEAALSASQAEFRRARLLHSEGQNVSLKDLQQAQAKFRADQASVRLANQKIADGWGEEIAGMAPATREALVAALAKRTSAIVRVSLPPGKSMLDKPIEARVTLLGYEEHPLTSRSVFYAPSVDPELQGQGFLLRVEASEFPLRAGAAVTAHLSSTGPLQHGVVIPRAAIVRTADQAWAYVQTAPESFARRQVATVWPTADGWFAMSGFMAGDRVVIVGAQTLLSNEFQSRIQSSK